MIWLYLRFPEHFNYIGYRFYPISCAFTNRLRVFVFYFSCVVIYATCGTYFYNGKSLEKKQPFLSSSLRTSGWFSQCYELKTFPKQYSYFRLPEANKEKPSVPEHTVTQGCLHLFWQIHKPYFTQGSYTECLILKRKILNGSRRSNNVLELWCLKVCAFEFHQTVFEKVT